MSRVCKHGHASAALPGGRNAAGACKECRNAVLRRWNAEHPRRGKERYDRMLIERPALEILNSARKRSRARGLPAPTITEEWISAQLSAITHCPLSLCGHVRLTRHKGKRGVDSPTLDQRDVTIAYTPENTALICYGCNTKKSNMTPQQLRELADYASANTWLALDCELRICLK